MNLLTLIRPLNSVITALVVIMGGLLAHSEELLFDWYLLILAGISAALVGGGTNSMNDYFDREIDTINRPDRPIPSGKVQPKFALGYGVFLTLLGISLGYIVSATNGLIAIIVALLLFWYNIILKRKMLIGNIVVALCAGLSFVYGAIVIADIRAGLIPALFAFLIHFARELVKDVEDLEGDRTQGVRSFAVVKGAKQSAKLAVTSMIVLILATPIPYVSGELGFSYMYIVTLFVNVPLGYLSYLLLKEYDNKATYTKASTYLKFIMIFGLGGLFLG